VGPQEPARVLEMEAVVNAAADKAAAETASFENDAQARLKSLDACEKAREKSAAENEATPNFYHHNSMTF